jgi:ribosomal protein L11 methyltransferase
VAWLQFRFDSDRHHAAALEDALLDIGAVSVTLQDQADEPVLEPGVGERPLWSQTQVVALFEESVDPLAVIASLTAHYGELPQWQVERLEDQVWERAWMDAFQPMQFGQRLWVCPSWSESPAADAVTLRLDPGLAFGTGTHPTTALCLEWLDAQPLAGCTVLDYGCGSGILAIAALLLGAERAIGVDNDPQALIATRDNARRNSITDERLVTFAPDEVPADLVADVTIANILAGPLQELAPRLLNHTASGGRLVLSGLLAEQVEAVMAAYRPACSFAAPALREEWARLDASRS